KLNLDDSSNAGLEIERVVTTAPFRADALQHGIDFAEQIRIAACDGPGGVRDCAKGLPVRAGYRPGASERLDLPKLGTIAIVGLEGLERADERSFFPFGTQARVNGCDDPFRTWE